MTKQFNDLHITASVLGESWLAEEIDEDVVSIYDMCLKYGLYDITSDL